ncbi:uncharacterized protein LOC126264867 [Aethina tumida]|uniref:uncharacterized protein LOC126264867 n=1 Tax=Aethina tumida TaxID=116153 RepID=UPI0021484D94|nr:uncharacterized protein LOC126264867 [Aethina tumida]
MRLLLIFLLIFLLYITYIYHYKPKKACSCCKTCNCSEFMDAEDAEKEELSITELLDDQPEKYESSHDPEIQSKCNCTIFQPAIVINPYTNIMDLVKKKPNFKSVGIRCAACLAVAEEISKIHKRTTEPKGKCSKERCAKRTDSKDDFVQGVEMLCQNGFKHHHYKKVNGENVVTDKRSPGGFIFVELEQPWCDTLRQLCQEYISRLTLDRLYYDDDVDWERLLCKSDGIFRECRNMDSDPHSYKH